MFQLIGKTLTFLISRLLRSSSTSQLATDKRGLDPARDEMQAQVQLLTEQLARFRATFEQAAIGLAHASPAGRFLQLNQRFCEIVGYTREELLGLTFSDITHPEDLAADWAQARELLAGSIRQYSIEKRYLHKDGHEVWINLTASLVSSGPVPEYFIAAVEDITRRKFVEVRLLESERILHRREQLLSSLFENGSMGDFSWDIASDEVSAHPSVWKLYGLSTQQGKGPGEMFRSRQHPEDAPAIEAAVKAALSAQAPLDLEFRVVRDDGSIRWIACRALVARDHAGVPVQTHGFNIDITALKTAEAELQRREQLFRELANAMPQVVWTATPDGLVDYYNDRWYEITGSKISPDEEGSWQPFVHPDDVPVCTDSWFSAVRSGRPFELLLRFRDVRLQAFRWHLSRAIPVQNGEGHVSRWIGTSTDIHEQKIAEDRLEQQVRNRTRDLEASLLEKETLLKEVHHRVKNNLQVIYSLLNMQANGLTDPLAISALRDSQRRVLAMAMVHERLYGKRQMDQIDFAEYVGALVEELIHSYGRTGVGRQLRTTRVLLNIDQAIPCGLILTELVTNALKYAYPGTSSGDITVELAETNAHGVTLTVSDGGVGLPADFNWKTAKSLGLPIVRILTKQIGGELSVASGPGATFTIKFPRGSKAPAERNAADVRPAHVR